MKGVIYQCLSQLVKEKYGEEKWCKILENANFDPNINVLSTHDVDDALVLKVVGSTCSVLRISLERAADAFGDYWVNSYAPKTYGAYLKNSHTAKEFLLKMDSIHEMVTRNIPNAHPPRFTYKWENDKTLIMGYKSKRGLIDFHVGLIKGVGRYFHEKIIVTKIANDQAKIIFC